MSRQATIHGSAVVLGEIGILIRGASGSGKSTLLLDLLAADPRGARMVADDRVVLRAVNGRLLADVPGEIAGQVEMRGVGIVSRSYLSPAVIHFVVDLEPAEKCSRLPEMDDSLVRLEGIELQRMTLPIGADGGARRVSTAIGEIFNRPG